MKDEITIRDYFAAAALQALISKLPVIDQSGEMGRQVADKATHNRDICQSAWEIANAMIATRQEPEAKSPEQAEPARSFGDVPYWVRSGRHG